MNTEPSTITMEEMKNVDIRTVDKSTLVDIKTVTFNPKLNPEEKTAEYIRQIKNPYCYLCCDYAVKLKFADNGKNIEDCFLEYIDSLM